MISLRTLASEVSSSDKASHYVTHSEFSADGRYVSFLHRWTENDIRERETRLIIFDLKNEFHHALPTEGMVSHYIWNKSNGLIAYCKVDKTDCHAFFEVSVNGKYKKIASDELNSDGHQSFISENSFITDTYPDKFRMSKIYKVLIDAKEVSLLASINSPKNFQTKDFKKHIACDLHPRVSPDSRFVSFDAIRNGKRSFCIMKIET